MKPHKFKAEQTSQGQPVQFRGYEGMAFTLQAVMYSSTDPSKFLHIYDKDGDPVSFPIPGGLDNPKLITVDPVTVELPLSIVDEAGGNSVLLRGQLTRQNKV